MRLAPLLALAAGCDAMAGATAPVDDACAASGDRSWAWAIDDTMAAEAAHAIAARRWPPACARRGER
jgi:hypothetical protein